MTRMVSFASSLSLPSSTNPDFFYVFLAFCKRGKELFRQLSIYAKPCTDLLDDYESKLEKEEMISHKMNPSKR